MTVTPTHTTDHRQWRLIDTVPKDGTEVDLWITRVETGRGARHCNVHHHCGQWLQYGFNIDGEGSWEPVDQEVYTPTHWMPLPEPPK